MPASNDNRGVGFMNHISTFCFVITMNGHVDTKFATFVWMLDMTIAQLVVHAHWRTWCSFGLFCAVMFHARKSLSLLAYALYVN